MAHTQSAKQYYCQWPGCDKMADTRRALSNTAQGNLDFWVFLCPSCKLKADSMLTVEFQRMTFQQRRVERISSRWLRR